MKKAVFLDRDGTINVEINYLHEPEKFKFIPKVPEALSILADLGFLLVVITNQGAIGKGLYDYKAVSRTHAHMVHQLSKSGVRLDAIYYCPHKNEDLCKNRKPEPGMLIKAIRKYGIEPSQSWMIGDKISDIQAGNRAGVSTILVKTGYGKSIVNEIINNESCQLDKIISWREDLGNIYKVTVPKHNPSFPTYIAESLWEAAELIKYLGK